MDSNLKEILEHQGEIREKKNEEIIEKYNLKPRDAIHVASALTNNIKEIVSDDPDFDKVKEIKRKKLK